MKKLVSMFIAAALVLGMGLTQSPAAESKPIAALTAASYNDLMSDVNFVGKLIERPQLGGALEGLLAIVTQGKGLAGVDKTRPWGAIVQASGAENISGYVFLPVTDFKEALGLLELYSTVDAEGGVYKLTPKDGKKASYVKQQGVWACIADKPDALAQCDADPAAVLGNLKKSYIVAGRIFLANVPAGLREKFISGLRNGIEKDAAKKDEESEEEFAQRKKVLEQIEPYLVRVAGDLDQVVFGWGLDRKAEKTFIDLSVTAKPGTQTAEEMDLATKATTNFAGFHVSSAAVNACLAGPIPAAKQQIAASLIAAARGKAISEMEKTTPEDKRAVPKEVLNDGANLLQKIVKGGHLDGAASVIVGPNVATGLLAGYVADGALLDKILHTVAAAVLADHPEIGQFVKLDAETLGAVHFHKISVPISADNPDQKQLVQLVGESLDVVIGIGKENAFVAAGRDAEATLKKAIVASSQIGPKAVLPLEVSLAIKPVVAFVAEVGKPQDRPQAAIAASELKKTPGKDHVGLTVRPISNGVQVHLEVEQGLVRLFGRLVVMGMEQKPHPESAPAL